MATKANIAAEIAEKFKFSNEKGNQIVDAILDYMCDELSKGNTIQLLGYFSVGSIHKPAHEGRNPQTGKTVQVPAKNRVVMKAGKYFKDACNKNN